MPSLNSNADNNEPKTERTLFRRGATDVWIDKGIGILEEGDDLAAIKALGEQGFNELSALARRLYDLLRIATVANNNYISRRSANGSPVMSAVRGIHAGLFNVLPLLLQAGYNKKTAAGLAKVGYTDKIDYPRSCSNTKLGKPHREKFEKALKKIRAMTGSAAKRQQEYLALKYFYDYLAKTLDILLENDAVAACDDFTTWPKVDQDKSKADEGHALFSACKSIVLEAEKIRQEIIQNYPTLYWEQDVSLRKIQDKVFKEATETRRIFTESLRNARSDLWIYIYNFIEFTLGNTELAKTIRDEVSINPDYLLSESILENIQTGITSLNNKLQQESEIEVEVVGQGNIKELFKQALQDNIKQFDIARKALQTIKDEVVTVRSEKNYPDNIATLKANFDKQRAEFHPEIALKKLTHVLYQVQADLSEVSSDKDKCNAPKTTQDKSAAKAYWQEKNALNELHGIVRQLGKNIVTKKSPRALEKSTVDKTAMLEIMFGRIASKINPELFKVANSRQRFFKLTGAAEIAVEINKALSQLNGDNNYKSILEIATLVSEKEQKVRDMTKARNFLINFFDFQGRALRRGIANTINELKHFAELNPEYENLRTQQSVSLGL